MISLLFSSPNHKEALIIVSAFKQYGYTIKTFKLDYNNYLKCLQMSPDIILVDIPYQCYNHIKFIKLIVSHPSNRNLIVLGYGPADILQRSVYFDKTLFSSFFHRPLKFSEMLVAIKEYMPEQVQEIEESLNALEEESDVEAIRSEVLLPSKKLQIITQHASTFLAFPFTVPRVISITNDPMSGAGELAKTIQTDPVIAAQVLKTSNTIYFARVGDRISRIKDAIVRIGFRETKRIVLCIGIMKIFEDKKRTWGFDRKKFWLHSIATAACTEYLFSRSKYNDDLEFAFLAGLLHDFGTIVMDEFIPEIFSDVLEKTTKTEGEYSSVFFNAVGLHPQSIGKEFLTNWKLHEMIIAGAEFKMIDIKRISPSSSKGFLQLSIHLAHILVKSLSIGHSCDQFIHAVPNDILKKLNLNSGIPVAMRDKIFHSIRELCEFLSININSMVPQNEVNEHMSARVLCYYSVTPELFSPHFTYIETLGYHIEKVSTLEKIKEMEKEVDLLIVSLSDVDPDTTVEFIDSEEFAEQAVENIILLTEHTSKVRDHIDSEHTKVLSKSIDARSLGKAIAEYFLIS